MLHKDRVFSIFTNLLLCLAVALSYVPAGMALEPQAGETVIHLPLVMRRGVSFAESAGVLDTSFGEDGWAMANLGGGVENATGAVLQPDGKLVIVGSALTQTMNDVVVARYNLDGSLDTTFDGDGKAVTEFAGDDYAMAVAIQPDGKILVTGMTWGMNQDFIVGRYNQDGSLDPTFGTSGKVFTDINLTTDTAYAIAVQEDGKILAAGYTSSNSGDCALVRYNADGTLDTTFSTDGKLSTNIATSDTCYGMVVQPDGMIVLAGYATPATKDFALLRYTANGTLDTNFDGDGKLTTDFATGSDYAYAVALQEDGKIVAAGHTGGGWRLYRSHQQ